MDKRVFIAAGLSVVILIAWQMLFVPPPPEPVPAAPDTTVVERERPAVEPMRAEIDLSNEDRRLRPGMYAAVGLTVTTDDAGRTVPSRAVRGQGPRHRIEA